MKKQGRVASLVSICVFSTTALFGQGNAIDVCYQMAQSSLRNISVSQNSDAATSALFSNYCYADGSTNNGAINASGNAVVQGLPIGAAFAQKDSASRFTQFCSQYQTSAAVASNQYNYANYVLSQNLQSVNDCVKAAANNFGLSYKVLTPSTLVINFSIPAGQTLTVNGLTPDKGVSCTGHDFSGNGGTISYTQATQQSISSAAGNGAITCVRDPMPQAAGSAGNQFYADKAVVVATNAGALDIFWPQDSVFPIVTASTIQKTMDALQAQITANKAEVDFNLLPLGTIVPWYSNAGAPPKGWVPCDGSDPAHCPNLQGRFLRGAGVGQTGGTGGQDSVSVGQHGSNNRHPDGNGWSIDGGHYMSGDNITVSTVPTYTNVLYIMKIANQ